MKSVQFIEKITLSLADLEEKLADMKLDRLAEEGKKYVDLMQKLAKVEEQMRSSEGGFPPSVSLLGEEYVQIAETHLTRIMEKLKGDAPEIRASISAHADSLTPFLAKYAEFS